MQRKFIIGIDGGSQSSKVTIFDTFGNVVCEGRESLRPMFTKEPGIVEHPDDDLFESVIIAAKIALAKFQGDVNSIIGIGLCSIRCCRCLIKEDGTLAHQVLSWMDERVARPFEKLNDEIAYVATTNGYLMGRLTGKFNDTAANYVGVWPIDFNSWNWHKDEKKYIETNLDKSMLYELKMPGEIGGYLQEKVANLLGIPSGLPVVHTANDKAVETLGTGLKNDKGVVISLGTYIAGMTIGDKFQNSSQNYWTNFACQPYKYLNESFGIRRGMWTVSWVKDLLGDEVILKAQKEGISEEELLNNLATKVHPGSDGLMCFLDWLAPVDALYKKGMFIGFDVRHTYAHMYRSVLEAIAMTMKTNIHIMEEELKTKFEKIIVTGGGSNSDLFMQIFADVFGIPASRNVVNGAASMGAAICVAVATGIYKDYDEAIDKMVKVRDTFEPNLENHELYNKFNEIYCDVTKYTDLILKRSYELFK